VKKLKDVFMVSRLGNYGTLNKLLVKILNYFGREDDFDFGSGNFDIILELLMAISSRKLEICC